MWFAFLATADQILPTATGYGKKVTLLFSTANTIFECDLYVLGWEDWSIQTVNPLL